MLKQDLASQPESLQRLHFVDQPESALDGVDALVIVTEWKAFRSPDFEVMRSEMKHPVIFDGRNLFDPASMKTQGFEYFGIGRS